MTKDKMVGCHHQLNGHESEQTLGDGEGQGSLVCCSPWGSKELDMTEQMNNNRSHRQELTERKFEPKQSPCSWPLYCLLTLSSASRKLSNISAVIAISLC